MQKQRNAEGTNSHKSLKQSTGKVIVVVHALGLGLGLG